MFVVSITRIDPHVSILYIDVDIHHIVALTKPGNIGNLYVNHRQITDDKLNWNVPNNSLEFIIPIYNM